MGNKYVRPFTLFQRIATSVTIDLYKNYVKPRSKNGEKNERRTKEKNDDSSKKSNKKIQ